MFVTEKGASVRQELGGTLSRLHDKIFGGGAQQNGEAEEDHHQDYLKKPHKTPKTDREALLKDHILTDSGAHE
ncbi:hypothetical protein [Mucilaginibacter antarcticus]|uniref:hypothetical protein n=1 Tax=Mucilaginibacter antarcticus TaxID=1855725 RepID=UPI00362DAF6E